MIDQPLNKPALKNRHLRQRSEVLRLGYPIMPTKFNFRCRVALKPSKPHRGDCNLEPAVTERRWDLPLGDLGMEPQR